MSQTGSSTSRGAVIRELIIQGSEFMICDFASSKNSIEVEVA